MKFRTRLLVTFLLAVLLPMIAFMLFVRSEMTGRLTAQYERRVDALIKVIEEDLTNESKEVATSLAVRCAAIVEDNRFRSATVDRNREERQYLLDYAGEAMTLARLSMFQIQDDTGRIISSGHFRNEFDRLEPELPKLLASTPRGTALVQARTPDTRFLALARVDSFEIANKPFFAVAGMKVERAFLARLVRDTGLTLELVHAEGSISSEPESGSGNRVGRIDSTGTNMEAPGGERDNGTATIARTLTVPYIDARSGVLTDAEFRVTHRLDDLQELRRGIDRWFLVTVTAAILLVMILVSWTVSRISRPLVELAEKTSRVDLDRLDIDFDTKREDEIGVLSRVLDTMTGRLRASTVLIKDAERRATLGELARQVNHDIKNGLTPIRNVFRHLAQLASRDPAEMSTVFKERQSTLDSSISYLEDLAANYARLSPRPDRRPCNINDIVRRVVADLENPAPGTADIRTDLGDGAVVLGDAIALRRILENLIDNAIDSLGSRGGSVTISTEVVADGTGPSRVRLSVTDTGKGLNDEQRAKVFDDFYTTKKDGTGLGLSIVRRLVMDLDGSVKLESEETKGSRFIIDLPRSQTRDG